MNNSKAIRWTRSSTRSWTKWMRAKHVKINHCYKKQKYDCARNLQLRKTKLTSMLEPLSLICSCLNKAIKQVHLAVTEHTSTLVKWTASIEIIGGSWWVDTMMVGVQSLHNRTFVQSLRSRSHIFWNTSSPTFW